ncbi:autotransporter domain-containing protein [Lysobacter arenosi]|uniref:Autotransporter domain-containing protein n=1 Tax=Lysobacter arenosi TaxID=2795387 RepID=A0ABX7RER3_9GAMM|nr:autotransporter domain-containing protein [Lysobacter arenosi]QSX76195.1 autotransporter domain-containing protein [Lysobacter arenosi]
MRRKELAHGLLARSVMLGLCVMGATACGGGGGGGNVRSDPPPVGPSAPNPPTNPPVTPPVTPPVEPPVTPPVTPPVEPPVTPPVEPPPDPALRWHLSVTGADKAQARGLSGKGVAIAFIDTGLDSESPALKGRIVAGRIDTNPMRNDWSVDDKAGEGTRHASIGAGSNAGGFVGGVAPGANLVDWRLLDDEPVDGTRTLGLSTLPMQGFAWAQDKARIYNISGDLRRSLTDGYGVVGDVFSSLVLRDDPATNPLMVVALERNNLSELPNNPASDPALKGNWINVTGVSSSDPSKLLSDACGQSRQFCMAAPQDVMVVDPATGQLVADSDVGYAAAMVSGAAAMVMEAFPQFSSAQVQQVLLGAATDLGAPGVDPMFGWGLLNVDKAVGGPSTFAWGDFDISLAAGDRVKFLNGISGAGGLVVEGPLNWVGPGSTAILYMIGPSTYTGQTTVRGRAAVLNVTNSLASPVLLTDGGQASISGGTFSGDLQIDHGAGAIFSPFPERLTPLVVTGDITNNGRLEYNTTYGEGEFQGSLTQTASGTYGIHLGDEPLKLQGKALLDGNLTIYDARDGYVAQSHDVVLTAAQGVTGNFSSVSIYGGLLLTATLGQDANSVWLDVTRTSALGTATAAGFEPTAIASGGRIDKAFDQIDSGKAQGDVQWAAAKLQAITDPDELQRTLSSLSGEIHNADTMFAMAAIEGSRNSLEQRVDALQRGAMAGEWSDNLASRNGWASFDASSSGWIVGNDARIGGHTFGLSMSSLDGDARGGSVRDRERNRQFDGLAYGNWQMGTDGYLLGSVAVGHMQRWIQRDVRLGADAFGLSSDYSHRYSAINLQAGRHFNWGRATLTPFVGTSAMQLDRDGFSEQGAGGFGLTSDAASMMATQALAGLRAASAWNAMGARWSLQGKVEWQQLLSSSGMQVQARFTGVDGWAPIVDGAFFDHATVMGLGLNTVFGRNRFSVELDSRDAGADRWTSAQLNWRRSF